MSNAVVTSTKSRLIAGAVMDSVVPHHDEPETAATSNAPAAIDFVHKYALTLAPHGRGTCGASYTGRARAGAACPSSCRAATMPTRSASAAGRWPQRYVAAGRCSGGGGDDESAQR